ncbi:helix-turn-helix domain-containing protein [Streptomyces sp. NPDC048338]|uniref:AraC-like ligand-binding domain-containing protein n=1 Tax=Streptomyces sp. NPDC048338 TaxID=3365536 RepID=UPI003717659A
MSSAGHGDDGMAPPERFEWFRDAVSDHVMPVSLSTDHVQDFHAEVSALDLGPVQLSAITYSPVLSRRTPAHVRQGDPEQYQLALVTGGAFRIAQRDNHAVVSGDLILTDTSQPSEGWSGDERATALILQIPRAVLPLRHDQVDRMVARRIPADRGTGAILGAFLGSVHAQGPDCEPAELAGLGSVALDLATACLARQLGSPDTAPAEARAQEMYRRVTGFIDNNLGDPDLTPRAVAERHNISLRTLHSLFRDRPLSVAARIRQGRLERAYADLGRREFAGEPVQTIAARWGFSSATSFSRAFREHYGTTPTERRAAGACPSGIARDVEKSRTPRTATPGSTP